MNSNEVLIYPVPWDVTTTFRNGTASAPFGIESVFHQMDDQHPFQKDMPDIRFLKVNDQIQKLQNAAIKKSRLIIDQLNLNQPLNENDKKDLLFINDASKQMNRWVYDDLITLAQNNKIILCGGEHGVGYGFVHALCQYYSDFSILQIDAHMDCRLAYFGFDFSHASIIRNYSNLNAVSSITQVGIRDFDASEIEFSMKSNTKFSTFFDYDIHKRLFEGETWFQISNSIVNSLSDLVFISLDIDGLMPYLSPNTGTPVPGGLSYNQLVYLLDLVQEHRTIIGAELVEVNGGGENNWDAIVGSRLLQLMAGTFV
ncbi:MAG: arginase family protein [Candidatus Margulisiibacteriota bacterium]